MKRTWSQ